MHIKTVSELIIRPFTKKAGLAPAFLFVLVMLQRNIYSHLSRAAGVGRETENIAVEHDRLEAGFIRKLWPADAARYGAHLLRLDDESRRNRFANTGGDDGLLAHAKEALCYPNVVHGFFVDGVLRGGAELLVLPRDGALTAEAEAAFSVEQSWQSHGVGSALLERTILAARNRGVALLHMSCLAHNQRMQQLARKFDADLTFDFGSVVGQVEAPYPTPMSMWREMVVDGHAVATAMLDRQARLLKPATEVRESAG